jgi:hypothetical protein
MLMPALPHLFRVLSTPFNLVHDPSDHALDVLALVALGTLWLCRRSISGSFVVVLALKKNENATAYLSEEVALLMVRGNKFRFPNLDRSQSTVILA